MNRRREKRHSGRKKGYNFPVNLPIIEELPGGGRLELHEMMGDDLTPARIARISYLSEGGDDERDAALLGRLIRLGHTSVFEHQVFRFLLDGVPMYIGEQILRHRIASYTKRSFRYTSPARHLPANLNEEFHIPPEFLGLKEWKGSRDPAELKGMIEDHIRKSVELYEELVNAGLRKEAARCILPAGTRTSFWWTINMRSAMNFLSLRLRPDAQWEIREVARAMARIFKKVVPLTVSEFLRQNNLEKYL